jgi:hypothetical protein
MPTKEEEEEITNKGNQLKMVIIKLIPIKSVEPNI